MSGKRYAITVYVEGDDVADAFELLAKMPVFEEVSKLAHKAGFRVTGYVAEKVRDHT